MNQDINLLMPTSGSGTRYPTARQSGIAVLCILGLGIVGGLWYDYENRVLQARARSLNTEIDDLVSSLEERSYFLAERNADPSLVAELKRREREADDKSTVLDLLSGESVGNTDGFSEQLAALGRRHPPGLWLERIQIEAGGREVLLRGLTLEADLVPRFLDNLRDEPVMAGMPFATLALSTGENERAPLKFALATACDALAADAGDTCAPADEPERAR